MPQRSAPPAGVYSARPALVALGVLHGERGAAVLPSQRFLGSAIAAHVEVLARSAEAMASPPLPRRFLLNVWMSVFLQCVLLRRKPARFEGMASFRRAMSCMLSKRVSQEQMLDVDARGHAAQRCRDMETVWDLPRASLPRYSG